MMNSIVQDCFVYWEWAARRGVGGLGGQTMSALCTDYVGTMYGLLAGLLGRLASVACLVPLAVRWFPAKGTARSRLARLSRLGARWLAAGSLLREHPGAGWRDFRGFLFRRSANN